MNRNAINRIAATVMVCWLLPAIGWSDTTKSRPSVAAAGLEGIRTLSDGTITPGDVILAVDGRSVDSVARLLSRLDDYAVGETVRLRVMRGNREREVAVRLQAETQ